MNKINSEDYGIYEYFFEVSNSEYKRPIKEDILKTICKEKSALNSSDFMKDIKGNLKFRVAFNKKDGHLAVMKNIEKKEYVIKLITEEEYSKLDF